MDPRPGGPAARHWQVREVKGFERARHGLVPLVVAERADSSSSTRPVALDRLTGLARRVIAENAAACEMNQRGLSAAPFRAGTLNAGGMRGSGVSRPVRARLGEEVADAGSRADRRG